MYWRIECFSALVIAAYGYLRFTEPLEPFTVLISGRMALCGAVVFFRVEYSSLYKALLGGGFSEHFRPVTAVIYGLQRVETDRKRC